MTDNTFEDIADFDFEAKRLARRRQIAEQVLGNTPASMDGKSFGGIYVPNYANMINEPLQRMSGNREMDRLDAQDKLLSANQAKNTAAVMEGLSKRGTTQGIVQGEGPLLQPNISEDPADRVPLNPQDEQARRAGLMASGMSNPSIRGLLASQFNQELDQPRQDQLRQEAAQQRQHERSLANDFNATQRQLDREARKDLRSTPTIHITNSGAATGIDSNGQPVVPDGKPLAPAQEKAALQLGADYSTLNQLTSTFKDEYAGDIRSSLERQFGKMAGGMAPASTQGMTRWWSDQAMFDELPQRHELFGAALTPTELKSWANASISPSLSPKVIRDRLATRKKLYEQAEQRMRDSAVAGGKSGRQFDAATGKANRPAATNPDVQPAPPAALEMLARDPSLAPAFQAKYGYLPGSR